MYERLIRMLKMNDVEYKTDQELSALTSIKIGGRAAIVILPNTADKLISVACLLQNEGINFKIVGRMTNVLPPDGYFNAPIITTRRLLGFSVTDDGVVLAGAGETLARILRYCAEKDLGGCEALLGIPGTLGGLVTMNAGAFGSEISDFFSSALAYDIEGREYIYLSRDEMCFSYRNSVIRENRLLVLSVKLNLRPRQKASIIADIDKYRRTRINNQPTEPSLGSVFMRSDGIIPAKLIDQIGLRGKAVGGAMVSEKHAGFIVNRGGATAADFKSLAEYIKREVYLRFGVTIREEVEYL